ncbi:hypothetical protein JCM10212_000954 [Sporobolomyces blumeae]
MLALAGRPEHIATLISGVDRYNPSNVHLLEDYLQQQLANGQYDILANLALLKLYQFNPTSLSASAALSVLFLALAHAPFSPDFNLAWSLLSDSFVTGAALPPSHARGSDDDDDDSDDSDADERRARKNAAKGQSSTVPRGEKEAAELLREWSGHLAARQFRQFWTRVHNSASGASGGATNEDAVRLVEGLKQSANGWDAAVRDAIAGEVECSFRSIKKETAETFLGTQDLSQIAQTRNWTVSGSDVQLPQNDSNTPKSSVTHERIEIEQLARLMGRSQA